MRWILVTSRRRRSLRKSGKRDPASRTARTDSPTGSWTWRTRRGSGRRSAGELVLRVPRARRGRAGCGSRGSTVPAPDPHESRRLTALAGSDGCLAGGRDREEALAKRAVEQNGLAAKALPDAQAYGNGRADPRPEGAGNDPEVVRGDRRCGEDQGRRRRENHRLAAVNGRRMTFASSKLRYVATCALDV